MATINGIDPATPIPHGAEIVAKSDSSTRTYKIKHVADEISCSCPAWRNQKKPTTARTCKHLRATLGDAYEDARLAAAESGAGATPAAKATAPTSKAAKAKPPSRATRATKRKRSPEPEADEENDNAAPVAPVATAAQPADDADDGGDPSDALSCINGVKPLVYFKEGDEKEAASQTSSSVYKVKRTGDHYYCTCPAWKMKKDAPINARTCKHLRAILGDAYEDARLEMMNPGSTNGQSAAGGNASPRKKAKPNSKKDTKDPMPALLLAVKWDLESKADPTGWWCSEKLDGVRAYFDGKQFRSRNGNSFAVPQNLIDLFPKDVTLDGELFGGRKMFNETVSVVRSSTSPKWAQGVVTYQIFDIPSLKEPFEDRLAAIEKLFGEGGKHENDFIKVVEHVAVKDKDHVLEMLKDVEDKGGEGLMLRKPGSSYENKRSNTLQKIKSFYDAEAEVIGHTKGQGKHTGATGALKCRMASGKTFNVGTGLSDALRAKPPKIGAIITYKFQELTPDGVPRFPTYVGEAIDKDGPTDAVVGSAAKGEDDA